MARLETVYKEKIIPGLIKQFGYKSVMEAPRITKITLNMGVGDAVADKKVMQSAVADMEKIDFAAKKSMNLFYGPFEMADKIGIDRVVRWLDNMYEEFGDLRYKASPILRRLTRANHLGRKTGMGFYKYDENGKKIEPALDKFIF